LTGLTGLLVALVMTVLLISPVLAVNPAALPGVKSNSYEGQTIRVETRAATAVTKSSATLNGFLESLGPYVEVYVWFELNNGMWTAPKKMTAPGPFSAAASGLASYTPYQFRAVVDSPLMGGQTQLGAYVPFHTLIDKPLAPVEVSTRSVSDITAGTVVLHGYLSRMEPYNAVKVWFNWGTSSGFGNTAGEQVLYAPGPFSIKISGLSPNVIYYYRAGAVPAVGGTAIVYSTIDTFTTLISGELAVSTLAGTNVTASSAAITGYLGSMGGYSSANVWFEWGTTAAYGQVTPMQTMNKAGIYTYNLQGLAAGTTYHFRALAIPGSAGWVTVRGRDNEFTTIPWPGIAIVTESASRITSNSAVLNGLIATFGSSGSVSAWFEYGTDTTYGNRTPQMDLDTPGNFTCMLTGLSPGTTYYFRSAALADGRPVSGQYSTFTTAASSDLSIATGVASSVSPSSALLHAYINSLGSAPDVRVWFNFGQSPECDRSTPVLILTSAGPVSAQASGLIADTAHYFQAVAQAPDGNMTYGKLATFRTLSISLIAVVSSPATVVTDSSAMLNGNIDNLGNATSVQVWFEYGVTPELGGSTSVMTLDSPVPFSSTVPVLPGATYYYRAAALNPAAVGFPVYGAIVSFVTASLPSPPVVSPIVSPYQWFIYCQRFISFEIERILKSLNIYPFK
jgi:hypothetical protein